MKLDSLHGAQKRTVDNPSERPNLESARSTDYVISDQRQVGSTGLQDRKEAVKGLFLHIPGLMVGESEYDHKRRSENGKA